MGVSDAGELSAGVEATDTLLIKVGKERLTCWVSLLSLGSVSFFSVLPSWGYGKKLQHSRCYYHDTHSNESALLPWPVEVHQLASMSLSPEVSIILDQVEG